MILITLYYFNQRKSYKKFIILFSSFFDILQRFYSYFLKIKWQKMFYIQSSIHFFLTYWHSTNKCVWRYCNILLDPLARLLSLLLFSDKKTTTTKQPTNQQCLIVDQSSNHRSIWIFSNKLRLKYVHVSFKNIIIKSVLYQVLYIKYHIKKHRQTSDVHVLH